MSIFHRPPTVLTIGTFDLLHHGHTRLFAICRGIAGPDGIVIVGINTDEFVVDYKKHLPVVPFAARREVVLACRDVDTVLENEGWDCRPLIVRAAPDWIVVGSDWAPPADYYAQIGVTQGWLDDRGIRVHYADRTVGISTTILRTRLLA